MTTLGAKIILHPMRVGVSKIPAVDFSTNLSTNGQNVAIPLNPQSTMAMTLPIDRCDIINLNSRLNYH